MDIDNICIALQKSNNKFEDQIDFFKTNYNKIFMTMGDKENKLYYGPVTTTPPPRQEMAAYQSPPFLM
jgi:hypothetical protein